MYSPKIQWPMTKRILRSLVLPCTLAVELLRCTYALPEASQRHIPTPNDSSL